MKKSVQISMNKLVLDNFNKALDDLQTYTSAHDVPMKRLRSSSACVLETDNYYLLCSYNTIVAVIDKSDLICYDAMRYVYGYTATSAKHIAKFAHDYSPDYEYSCTCYRYYPI